MIAQRSAVDAAAPVSAQLAAKSGVGDGDARKTPILCGIRALAIRFDARIIGR